MPKTFPLLCHFLVINIAPKSVIKYGIGKIPISHRRRITSKIGEEEDNNNKAIPKKSYMIVYKRKIDEDTEEKD